MPRAQLTTEGNTSTVTFPKVEKPAFEPYSIPSVDGFNLSEFSLSPLGQKTKHFANGTFRHEWVQVLDDGTEKLCFFEKSYGNVAPNSDTEDALVILTHLGSTKENPLAFQTSFYEALTLKNPHYKPNAQQVRQFVRHLDALYGMSLHTNFVYDREQKAWKTVKTRVLAAYSYKDDEGRPRKRRIRKHKDGDLVEVISDERVKELSEINFTSLFYKHFIQDAVPFDLGVYFALGRQTAKRIFRFGNKYVQTYGHHSLDLQLFCMSRIGMSPNYVFDKRPSYLASKVRPDAQRVTETNLVTVRVTKSPNTPSGYKISFDKPVVQISFPSMASGFTAAEEKAFTLLRNNGLYQNVAKSVIIKARKVTGKDAPRYIEFVVRQFKKDWIKTNKIKAPKEAWPAVLTKLFKEAWYYPHFIEWRAAKEKQEHGDEMRKYPGVSDLFTPSTMQDPSPQAQKTAAQMENRHVFSLDRFQKDHSKIFQEIEQKVALKYQRDESILPKSVLSDEQLEKQRTEALTFYCKQCFQEFKKGNSDFFPPALLED